MTGARPERGCSRRARVVHHPRSSSRPALVVSTRDPAPAIRRPRGGARAAAGYRWAVQPSRASTRPAVDWATAERRAAAIAPPGPRAARAELEALVDDLRSAARRAPVHVGRVTGLRDAAQTAAGGPVYVVDRARWARVNLQMFRHILEGVLPPGGAPGGARLAAEEMGVVLGVLSTKVLGQFDPFTPAEVFGASHRPGPGRLVLVAPNVLHAERQMHLDPRDFRLWVCLHEQTHAVQFAAAPWLAEHLAGRLQGLVTGLEDLGEDRDRLQKVVEALPRILRGVPVDEPSGGGALLDVALDEQHRSQVAEAVAVMSLLEGHADVVMDAAGPGVVRSLRRIRQRFEARRDGRGPADVLLRRLLGLDAKVAQYRTGAAFVRGVVGAVGHVGLNAVWSGPGALPTPAEIVEPAAWVRRVHG